MRFVIFFFPFFLFFRFIEHLSVYYEKWLCRLQKMKNVSYDSLCKMFQTLTCKKTIIKNNHPCYYRQLLRTVSKKKKKYIESKENLTKV